MRVRKNDTVLVISGRDRGKRGRVLSVHPETQRVVIEGAAMVKRHTKPNPQLNQPGGIIEREAPIHVSNVMLLNTVTGKGERVGFKTLAPATAGEKPRKVRVFRKSGEMVDA